MVDEESQQAYVFTAYMDDRSTPDVDSSWLPVVRVFAWFRRNESETVQGWRCVFWDQQLGQTLETVVVGWTDLNTFDSSVKIMSAMILCPLQVPNVTINDNSADKDYIRGSSPFAVSVVTSSCRRPRNLVRVVDLRQRRLSGTSSNYIVDFTVCVPPVFGNLDSVPDFVEFIEVNRVFGAQKFQFYNESVGQHLSSCLREYERRDVIDVQPWSLPTDIADPIYYYGHILAITECLYRHMYLTKYLIVQDMDEFVVPMRLNDWRSMLNAINVANSDNIASYNFRNRFFPMKSPVMSESDFINGNYHFKTLTVVNANKDLYPFTVRSKVMARPERIIIWHVHLILDSSLVRHGDLNAKVDAAEGQLFHYRSGLPIGPVTNGSEITRMKDFESQIRRRLNVGIAAVCLTGDYHFP